MMLPFLQSQLATQPGKGIIDLCLDYKLIEDIHPAKFTSIAGLDLFPHLEIFSASMQAIQQIDGLRLAPKLRQLDLSLNEIADLSPITHLNHLEHLNASHNEIADISTIDFPPTLQDLDLSFNQIHDLHTLQHLQNLKRLSLNGNRNLSTLDGLPDTIQELHLAQCFIQTHEALLGNLHLTTLTLSPGVMKGLELLSVLPKLRILNLHARRIYGAIALPPMVELEVLRIHKPQQVLTISGFEGLPQLQHLEISHSLLDSPPRLKECTNLQTLEISFSPLKNLDGIAHLPSLKTLRIRNTPIISQAIATLQTARPDLEIEF